MAFRLDRIEKQNRNNLINDLRTKQDEFEALKSSTPTTAELQTAASELLVLVGEAEEFRDSVASRLRDEFDEKSEKWQESETGEAASAFIDEWENVSFDDFEIDDDIADLEPEDFSSLLQDLPEE